MNKVKVEKVFNTATGVKVEKEINGDHLAEYLTAGWKLAQPKSEPLPELKGIKIASK